jgi:hypothetical protein
MRRMLTLLSLSAILAAADAGLMATPAGADTIVRSIIDVNYSDTITDLCAFPIEEHVQGSFKRAAYFDNNGNLIKVMFTPTGGPLTITWSANGITATTVAQANIITFYADGTLTGNGIQANFIIPGVGTVFQDVGRFILDPDGNLIFKAGPSGEDAIDTLCQALSG